MSSTNTVIIAVTCCVLIGIAIFVYLQLKKSLNKEPEKPSVIYVPQQPQIITKYVPQFIPDFGYNRRWWHRRNYYDGDNTVANNIVINNENNQQIAPPLPLSPPDKHKVQNSNIIPQKDFMTLPIAKAMENQQSNWGVKKRKWVYF